MLFRPAVLLPLIPVLISACVAELGSRRPHERGDDDDGGGYDSEPPVLLDPGESRYRGACDGSAAVALDFTHFLGFSDDDQVARVYQRGASAAPRRSHDLATAIGVPAGQADIEDAARLGSRIYLLGSHARTGDGTLDPDRHLLISLDLTGEPPDVAVAVRGRATRLVRDLLDPASWAAPDPALIAALAAAAQPDQAQVASLAPTAQGLNLEGLAFAPITGAPDRLVIGLRNPRPGGRAVVVTLVNPSKLIAGLPARFGEAIALDLAGLGIRGMTWSPARASVIVLAGPHDDASGPYRLYRWSGAAGAVPQLITEIAAPAGARPEAVIAYPGTADVQLLFDGEAAPLGAGACGAAPAGDREVRDQIVHIP